MVVRNSIIWIGGFALLAATFIDTTAVIGRHVGLPLTGSIELMQAIVMISGATGLVIASWDDVHARVRLLVDRLGKGWRFVADWVSDALTLLFVLSLLIGSVWLALDLWDGHEQSEWLGVPWALLRLIANVCLLGVALILLFRLVRGREQ